MADPLDRLSELLDEAERAGHAGVPDSAYAAVTKTAHLAPSVLREAIAIARTMRVVDAVMPAYYGGGMRDYDIPAWVARPVSLATALDELRVALERFEAAVAAGLGEG